MHDLPIRLPVLRDEFDASVAEIGFLMGVYLFPGIALALPGGAIGKRYGDEQVVIFGYALMTCGGLVKAFANRGTSGFSAGSWLVSAAFC
jgi:MFS family permease